MRIDKRTLDAKKSEYMVTGYRRKLNRVSDNLPDLVPKNSSYQRAGEGNIFGVASTKASNGKSNAKPSITRSKGDMLSEKVEKHPSSTKT